MADRKIGMWMYSNGGGDVIEKKIVDQLKDREIDVFTELNLRFAKGSKEGIICNNLNMLELDLFFSYNAGEQTNTQVYMYETIDKYVTTMNSYASFALSEDKFRSNIALNKVGIATTDFFLCHRESPEYLVAKFKEWEKLVFKPIDGWGGNGMILLESSQSIDALMPFLNQTDIRHIYLEKFIDNDFSDYRIDIVDDEFISCYGRKANAREWRTNISSGGSIMHREANDKIIDIAKKATKALGLDIAGVDIMYDREKEEYIVLEVNGIPAFATPKQEKLGLNFNDKKIEKIVNLIDSRTKHKKR